MRANVFAIAVLFLLPALPVTAAALSFQDLVSLHRACGNDIKTLCPGMSRGGGRIAQCVMAHASSVSAGCAAVLKADKAKLPATAAGATVYDTD
jgi:hypothetical protein